MWLQQFACGCVPEPDNNARNWSMHFFQYAGGYQIPRRSFRISARLPPNSSLPKSPSTPLKRYEDSDHSDSTLFKYTPKGCKIQIVMAGRLLTVLDMRPSTTNNPTSNQDPQFTPPPKATLVWGPYSNPKWPLKIANKPRHPLTSLQACCIEYACLPSVYFRAPLA